MRGRGKGYPHLGRTPRPTTVTTRAYERKRPERECNAVVSEFTFGHFIPIPECTPCLRQRQKMSHTERVPRRMVRDIASTAGRWCVFSVLLM